MPPGGWCLYFLCVLDAVRTDQEFSSDRPSAYYSGIFGPFQLARHCVTRSGWYTGPAASSLVHLFVDVRIEGGVPSPGGVILENTADLSIVSGIGKGPEDRWEHLVSSSRHIQVTTLSHQRHTFSVRLDRNFRDMEHVNSRGVENENKGFGKGGY